MQKASTGDLAMDALVPFMTRRRFKAGDLVPDGRPVARAQADARQGNTSQTDADDALAEVFELERMRANRESMVAHAEERLQAADRGVFLASDGRSPE
jgi:hypothetical protein